LAERDRQVPDTLRKKIYNTFDDPSYNLPSKVISVVMMLVILISTLAFILETELLDGGAFFHVKDDAKTIFERIEFICVILFTIDYLVRLLSCPKLCRFFWNTMNLIDLAAILPFWVILIVNAVTGTNSSGSFGFVRVIRLIRVFRVFKFGRYSIGLQMFAGALKGSVQPMGILVFVMSINMIILSSIVHILELPHVAEHYDLLAANSSETFQALSSGELSDSERHTRCFGTIARTFWWSMVTMTTVGYGECTPLSGGGKVFAIVAMLSGVLILALPITVIGSNFAKMVEMFEDDAAMYSMTDMDGDGLVDEMELREFLTRKRKEGVLRKDIDTKVSTLMDTYDPQGNGSLSMPEFLQLQRDVVDQTVLDPAAEIHDMHSKVSHQERQLVAIEKMVNHRMSAIEEFLSIMGEHMRGNAGAGRCAGAHPPATTSAGSSGAVGGADPALVTLDGASAATLNSPGAEGSRALAPLPPAARPPNEQPPA
jgi:hypothetical protein